MSRINVGKIYNNVVNGVVASFLKDQEQLSETRMKSALKGAQTFLAVRTDRIGDMLLATPMFRAIKEQYPKSKLMVAASLYNAKALEGNKRVDETLIVEGAGIAERRGAMERIRSCGVDVAIDPYHVFNMKSAQVCLESEAKLRVGYRSDRGMKFFNYMVEAPPARVYEVEKNLAMLRSVGLETGQQDIEFGSRETSPRMEDFMSENGLVGTVVAVNPGARRKPHEWDAKGFAEVADRLARKYDCRIVITWGPGDERALSKMAAAMKERSAVAPCTTLMELSALLKKCALFVCCDTAPLHVAVAAKTNVVALFGTGEWQRWTPKTDKMRVVKGKSMKSISEDEVFSACAEMLGRPVG